MWMTEYVREVKKQLRDKYGFVPDRTVGDEPCFDHIPDGDYPMTINGKLDRVKVVNGRFVVSNLDHRAST